MIYCFRPDFRVLVRWILFYPRRPRERIRHYQTSQRSVTRVLSNGQMNRCVFIQWRVAHEAECCHQRL
ncbi:hypothetical protein PO909_012178 [Leuciscus waleckii]